MIGSNGTCLATWQALSVLRWSLCIRVVDFSSSRFQEQTHRVAISRIFDRFKLKELMRVSAEGNCNSQLPLFDGF